MTRHRLAPLLPAIATTFILLASTRAHAATQTFTIAAALQGSTTDFGGPIGTVSGSLTIDDVAGTVSAANITTSLTQTFFITPPTGAPDSANPNLYHIASTDDAGDSIQLTLPVSSLIAYPGGPLSAATVSRADGSTLTLASASFFNFGTANINNETVTQLALTGTLSNGSALGGQLIIDPATGAVLFSDLRAAIPSTYNFSSLVIQFPFSTHQAGFTVLFAHLPSDPNYPMQSLDINAQSFVGYTGSPLSDFGDFSFPPPLGGPEAPAIGTISGALTLTPEPTSLCLLLPLTTLLLRRRH